MRMQDAGMAAALSRLRIRACTHDDVNLFNSNVLRSTENPTGVEVKGRGGLVVLARTNATVRALNERKASVQASMDRKNLTTSHAIDKSSVSMDSALRRTLLSYNGQSQKNLTTSHAIDKSSVSMDSALRRTLLSYNGQSQKRKIGAARLPLYIGMPIVYRGRNASICLGVTNGAFGSVAGWDVSTDKWGHKVATGAVIRFDEEAQWSLTGLQPGCLPVYPATTSFSFKDEDDVKHSISRRQLPLQPRFAMTVHSAQGMTSKGGVAVELSNGGFEAYVSASRCTRREDVFLLKAVDLRQLNSPPLPEALRAELSRLQTLANRTKTKHGHQHWRLSSQRGSDNSNDQGSPTKRPRTK
ncbi:unnamed protein product [Tilletia controversa]|nr:unnamed protein product [Tilletia controversa]